MLRLHKTFVELREARINPPSMEAIRIKPNEEITHIRGAGLEMESQHSDSLRSPVNKTGSLGLSASVYDVSSFFRIPCLDMDLINHHCRRVRVPLLSDYSRVKIVTLKK